MSRKLAVVERKTVALNMRTTPALRAKVEAAAAASGRSIAQETERRLERSFADNDRATLIREQMAAILEPAIEQAVAKVLVATPEPIGSPPPVYRQ